MLYYLAIPVVAFIALKGYVVYQSKYFTVADFRGWHVFLSFGVLRALDRFAEKMDTEFATKVYISPATGSIVRFTDRPTKKLDHLTGRAIDIMIDGAATLAQAYQLARQSGFNAIGVYPFWKPHKGLHLAVRRPITTHYSWADVSRIRGKHEYVAIQRGFYYG